MPWVFDRIEVVGYVPEGDREREVRFSLLGAWHCDYRSGPHLSALANYCSKITGKSGYYGLVKARRVTWE